MLVFVEVASAVEQTSFFSDEARLQNQTIFNPGGCPSSSLHWESATIYAVEADNQMSLSSETPSDFLAH